MAQVSQRYRRSSILRRESTVSIDPTEQLSTKKLLLVHGTCSETFKSTLEDCVEDCFLQFQGEKPIYIPKSSHRSSFTGGNSLNVRFQMRENSAQANGSRSNSTNHFALPSLVMSATRIRHPVFMNRFARNENICEELSEVGPASTLIESQSDHPASVSDDVLLNPASNNDSQSQSTVEIRSKSRRQSARSRQTKEFRLSDLVMLGPERFTDVFQLPRPSHSIKSTTTDKHLTTKNAHHKMVEEKYSELDQVKKDLFHRYLWTNKPQVSCRIRPISSYARSTSSVK